MDVSGMGAVQGNGPLRSTSPLTSSAPANAASASTASANTVGSAKTPGIATPKDEVEISAAGKMLERLSESPEARAERIAQIKQAIDDGDFDSDAKLEAALERMFEIHGFDWGDE